MKIALVVPGRFHAFDLARALLARGHDVTVFTNYPAWAAARFGLPAAHVRSFTAHGAVTRVASRTPWSATLAVEARLHQAFGRWATEQLERGDWDLVHVWSGVAEEILRSPLARTTPVLLMRGSTHIAVQDRLLRDEEARAGRSLDRPSAWMIAREEREYDLADWILVLSTFARHSFEEQGLPAGKLLTLPLGVDAGRFRPTTAAVAARVTRVASGAALRVAYVGAVSYRKGLHDLIAAVRRLEPGRFEFTLTGRVLDEARDAIRALGPRVEIAGPKPQAELPAAYAAADLLVLPTLEDGFSLVLAQAHACGLPVIASERCSAPDWVVNGRDGWIVRAGHPEDIVDRLTWCDKHRREFASMAASLGQTPAVRDWSSVAADFEACCRRIAASAPESGVAPRAFPAP